MITKVGLVVTFRGKKVMRSRRIRRLSRPEKVPFLHPAVVSRVFTLQLFAKPDIGV